MKIAILTGGGDCPGMNAFIRAVVRSALNLSSSISAWGVIDGWKGLVFNNFKRLNKKDTAGIANQGGTILGTLRAPEIKDSEEIQEAIAMDLHDNFFEYLLVIGGNGSLKASHAINNHIKRLGLRTKILVASGSIDNDVCNNFGFSVGFYSAIDKSLEMLEWIRDTASAHRRVYLIKSMGRDSGYLAFYSGLTSGAEHIIRPGEDVNYEKLATIINERDRDTRIIVAEGYVKSLDEIQAALQLVFDKRNIKHEIRHVDMGYFQRGGKAVIKDIMLASWLAYSMVRDIIDTKPESGFYTSYHGGQKPTMLTLDQAADDNYSVHLNVPDSMLDFYDALL